MATSPSAVSGKAAAHSTHRATRLTTTTEPPLNDYEGYENSESIVEPKCTDFYDTFCFSYGFNFFTLEFAIIVLLTLLHTSMIMFLIVRGKKDKAFREAFFIQFLAVSVLDCVRMVFVSAEFR